MTESALNSALRQFDAVEANLGRAEKLLELIDATIPKGIVFGDSLEHEQYSRDFADLFAALPKIDGWKPNVYIMDLNELAQSRLDAMEVGEFESQIAVENQVGEPAKALREYRHRFTKKRRALARDALNELIDIADLHLHSVSALLQSELPDTAAVGSPSLEELKLVVAQIGMLLGSSITKPPRWTDLHRHLAFGEFGDLHDIVKNDWRAVRAGLRKSMYGVYEVVPVAVDDLGALVSARPSGPVVTRLKWHAISEDEFERLVFVLISSVSGYENPEWSMKTYAPDRGRDLSVARVYEDELGGTIRHRVIIQCKHWQSKSVGLSELTILKEQMKLWEPPRIDVCIIATTGRFTSDAVLAVERQNHSDSALRLEMWPESHLERLLATRPAIIAEFGLR